MRVFVVATPFPAVCPRILSAYSVMTDNPRLPTQIAVSTHRFGASYLIFQVEEEESPPELYPRDLEA